MKTKINNLKKSLQMRPEDNIVINIGLVRGLKEGVTYPSQEEQKGGGNV